MPKLSTYARIEDPQLRWAWIGLVVEGPSVEVILGPFAVTVSWGLAKPDQTPYVFALRRERQNKMRKCHDPHNARSSDPGGASKA